MGAQHIVQLALVAVIAAVAAHRTHVLGVLAGIQAGPVFGALKHGREPWLAALGAHGETSALAELARAAVVSDPLELEVALRSETARLTGGLKVLRALGAASTGLGFAAALFDIAWVSQDHGLLDLDPQRVARMGMESAALSVALGVGGSGLALSSLIQLRDRARVLLRDLERLADLLRE